MKKLNILLLVVIIATSCSIGTYYPYAQNNFGAQSKVVLKKANFRVVCDVEAIVDVNNTNLSRADVASSAYGELLRKAQLTGSQVLINVVIEEVRRESAGFFRLLFGMPKRVQHVAARATIIEFLDENGNPTVSKSYRPTNTQTTTVTAQPINNSNANVAAQEVEIINTQPTQPMASPEYIPKYDQVHKRIETLINRTLLSGQFQYKKVSDVYKKLYHVLPFTEENLIIIQKIQTIVIEYFKSETNTYPLLQKQLQNASSMEEEIQIFLSYYQE